MVFPVANCHYHTRPFCLFLSQPLCLHISKTSNTHLDAVDRGYVIYARKLFARYVHRILDRVGVITEAGEFW
jgi:hypothetical protein